MQDPCKEPEAGLPPLVTKADRLRGYVDLDVTFLDGEAGTRRLHAARGWQEQLRLAEQFTLHGDDTALLVECLRVDHAEAVGVLLAGLDVPSLVLVRNTAAALILGETQVKKLMRLASKLALLRQPLNGGSSTSPTDSASNAASSAGATATPEAGISSALPSSPNSSPGSTPSAASARSTSPPPPSTAATSPATSPATSKPLPEVTAVNGQPVATP